ARLGLSDAEIESMREKLSQVLEHIAVLDKLDTSAISPTAQILTSVNTMRDDISRASLPAEAVLKNAPVAEDGYFRVPPVLEEIKRPTDGPANETENGK
ncbi:MAG TPA: Asp-tRNA(Asn)/Glu-tRNA(Gln) amidotransferase subunit GatC, partial [Chloroflexia bacterium]|nr:Asp-tRNA(Asn)/Glu-tRNA(Gln) amidotransferase subunit GatC [Chloroflexia bacterium]